MCKSCRVRCWQLPVTLDMITSALSRADLFTDIGFISLMNRCGRTNLFISSLSFFLFGVIGLQCCPPFVWGTMKVKEYEYDENYNEENWLPTIVLTRGVDMILISKLLKSIHVLENDDHAGNNAGIL